LPGSRIVGASRNNIQELDERRETKRERERTAETGRFDNGGCWDWREIERERERENPLRIGDTNEIRETVIREIRVLACRTPTRKVKERKKKIWITSLLCSLLIEMGPDSHLFTHVPIRMEVR
jgi:hypothetical protein